MAFSQLDGNERLATYGAVAVVVGGLISTWGGLLFLAILAAVGMLLVVWLPQLSAQTALPGSKGTLMAALGIVAAVSAVVAIVGWLGLLAVFGLSSLMFVVAVVGSFVMAWAGWHDLQAEGGRWRFGTAGTARPHRAPNATGESELARDPQPPSRRRAASERGTQPGPDERRTEG